MFYPFHPYNDPYNDFSMLQDVNDITSEEQKKVGIGIKAVLYGCCAYTLVFALVVLLCILISSCNTHRYTTTSENHSIENIIQRIDSVIVSHTIVRQDSAWRETIMQQFQSIREKNDTSHTFVIDTAGQVIKETLIIRTERETTSETDRQERQMLMHRMEVMDSTLVAMQQSLQHTDSLIHQEKKVIEKPVEKPLTWWQQLRLWLGNLVLLALGIAAVVWLVRKKVWRPR